MRFYPAIFEADQEAGGFVVHFPQFGGWTQGDTLEEAQREAEELLLSYIEDYFKLGRVIPEPAPIEEGQVAVMLASSVVAKVLLHNAMVAENVNKAELARRLNMLPQEVQRLLKPRVYSKIDTISRALATLGHPLQFSVV